ncbi:MAG TPA: DNA polymerase III subunit gamma/tau, partial [Bacteroidales bacterium]|nr:DNA polymerase III subunit gamma/tau [Bacteroidales bacterium]
MENFIVSARKYRPSSFDMVVGQDSITKTLKSAIKNNHLAQAYLFCGPRGVGKTTCARIFAKTINCNHLDENFDACDECESCLSFNSNRSFNIHELDAASNNKVEDIRSLNEQVRIPPQVGKYSIYIIDEVHMLSSSAFNAFLKTLEEPPSHAIFILATTEKHKIIPTILSRCQIFDFNRIRIYDIVNRLMYVTQNEGIEASEEALHIIGQKADGAMRDALSIFDQIVSLTGKKIEYKDVIENLNVLDYEYYFKTVEAAVNGDVSSALLTFNEVLEKGFDGHNFISGLNSHLRDLLVSKDQSTVKLLEATPGIKQKYLQQTGKCPVDFLYKALETGSNCDLAYKSSKNQRLHVELALIKLCMLTGEQLPEPEKKKHDNRKQVNEEEIPLPSKSEIIRDDIRPGDKKSQIK